MINSRGASSATGVRNSVKIVHPLNEYTLKRLANSENINVSDTAIKKILQNKEVELLKEFLEHFEAIQDKSTSLVGLSKTEQQDLKNILPEHNKLNKEFRANGLSKELGHKVINIEQRLEPYHQRIAFWHNYCTQLQNNITWQEITNSVKNYFENIGISEEEINIKLDELNDLKQLWIGQKYFSEYDTEELLLTYKDYLLEIESVVDKMDKNIVLINKSTQLFKKYLDVIKKQIIEAKQAAVYSMLLRIKSALYFNDIKCDDIISYLLEVLEKKFGTKYNLYKFSVKQRRAMSASNLVEIDMYVQEYINFNNDNENFIQKIYQDLDYKKIDKNIASLMIFDKNSRKIMANPILAIYVKKFSMYLSALINNSDEIVTEVVNNDNKEALDDLKKAKNLYNAACVEYIGVTGLAKFDTDNRFSLLLDNNHRLYENLLNNLADKIEIMLQSDLEIILEECIKKKSINFELKNSLIKKINNAKWFLEKFLNNKYFSPSDIILNIAYVISRMYKKNITLTSGSIHNLMELIKDFYANDEMGSDSAKSIYLKRVEERLSNYWQFASELPSMSDLNFMHKTIKYLESPILQGENLYNALKRHFNLLKNSSKSWDTSIYDMESDYKPVYRAHMIASYVSNVAIPLLKYSPQISIKNFDTHDNLIASLLEEANAFLSMEDDLGGIPDSNNLKIVIKNIEKKFHRLLLDKINNIYDIKNYLLVNGNIDFGILSKLVQRVSNFFPADIIIDARNIIIDACKHIISDQIIDDLHEGVATGIDYISNILQIIDFDLMPEFAVNKNIYTAIENCIKSNKFNGTIIHQLLLKFYKIRPNEYSDLLVKYSKLRLESLKNFNNITPADHEFFGSLDQHKVVNAQIASFKKEVNQTYKIDELINREWQEHLARYIELFGEPSQVTFMRSKFIKEILADVGNKISIDIINSKLKKFTETVNYFQLKNQSLINLNAKDNYALKKIIDACVKFTSDHELINTLFNLINDKSYKQSLHFQHLIGFLQIENSDFNGNDWIFNDIAINSEKLQSDIERRQFFIEYFNEKNINALIRQIDKQLEELAIFSTWFGVRMMSANISKYGNLLNSLRKLEVFYNLFGNDKGKAQFKGLNEIERRLLLSREYNQLSQVIPAEDELPTIEKIDEWLDSLLNTVASIDAKGLLSATNIEKFFSFFNNSILRKIKKMLVDNNIGDYSLIEKIAQLIIVMQSDNFREVLFNVYHQDAESNPLWLMLINHFGSNSVLAQIDTVVKDHLNNRQSDEHDKVFSDNANINIQEFLPVYELASNLQQIKNITKSKIKEYIFGSAGIYIPLDFNKNLSELLQFKGLNTQELFRLWGSCDEILYKALAKDYIQAKYIMFLFHLRAVIIDQTMSRIENVPDEYSVVLRSRANDIENIFELVKQRFAKSGNSGTSGSQQFWNDTNEYEKAVHKVCTFTYAPMIKKMQDKVDIYLEEHLKKASDLHVLKKISETTDSGSLITIDQAKRFIRRRHIGLHRLREAKKIQQALYIHKQLDDLLHDKLKTPAIVGLAEDIIKNAYQLSDIRDSKSYNELLAELKKLLSHYGQVSNDSQFFVNEHKNDNIYVFRPQ